MIAGVKMPSAEVNIAVVYSALLKTSVQGREREQPSAGQRMHSVNASRLTQGGGDYIQLSEKRNT